MKCPTCPDTRLVISERKGIEIDYCPDCRGVWLDRGELDKILERSREDDRPEPREERPRPMSDVRYPDHKSYKRKKSIFEELFD